jgi:hypothetical protein
VHKRPAMGGACAPASRAAERQGAACRAGTRAGGSASRPPPPARRPPRSRAQRSRRGCSRRGGRGRSRAAATPAARARTSARPTARALNPTRPSHRAQRAAPSAAAGALRRSRAALLLSSAVTLPWRTPRRVPRVSVLCSVVQKSPGKQSAPMRRAACSVVHRPRVRQMMRRGREGGQRGLPG